MDQLFSIIRILLFGLFVFVVLLINADNFDKTELRSIAWLMAGMAVWEFTELHSIQRQKKKCCERKRDE